MARKWIADLKPGAESYEQKVTRHALQPGELPGPHGSYRSFTAVRGSVSVTIMVWWSHFGGWSFNVEVWDLRTLDTATKEQSDDRKILFVTRDAPRAEHPNWRGKDFWLAVEFAIEHAKKIVALFGGTFPEKLVPFSRNDAAFGNNPPELP